MLFVLCGRAGGRAGLRVATQVYSEREARAAKAMQGIIALQAAIPPCAPSPEGGHARALPGRPEVRRQLQAQRAQQQSGGAVHDHTWAGKGGRERAWLGLVARRRHTMPGGQM